MNRGDLRLIVAILGTAVLSSIITVVVYARATEAPPEPPTTPDPRIEVLQTQLRALEAQLAERKAEAEGTPVVAPAPDPEPCDEVACVLNNYEAACCAAFKKPHGLPESLDRQLIVAGVGAVKPQIQACGAKTGGTGMVKVAVKVAPDGHVASATVRQADNVKLGECVAAAMQRALFGPTQTGGSFSYPFVF
jgi:hypothetical protein